LNAARDLTACFRFCRLDFANEFRAPVNISNQVFKIVTGLIVAFPATGESLQLCLAKEDRTDDPNSESWLQLSFGGSAHRLFVPAVGETEDLFIKGHHIEDGLILSPSA
jgi:hypothetical protein